MRADLLVELHEFLDDVVHAELDYEIYRRLKEILFQLEPTSVKPIVSKNGKRFRCGSCNESIRHKWSEISRVGSYCDKCGTQIDWGIDTITDGEAKLTQMHQMKEESDYE